jgi:DNA helicase-2/ATP-dependent DNA helicase PcrA
MNDEQFALKGDQYPPEASVKLNGPPGTGKTTQLLERVTRLLDGGYDPNDVVFVTYRKEMAKEFLRRLHERGYISEQEYQKPWENDTRHFGTLHAVCNRITSDAAVVEKKHRRDFMLQEYSAKYDGRGSDWDEQPSQRDPIGTLLFDAYDWCVENKQHSFIRAPNYAEIKDQAISPPSFEEFSQAWSRYKAEGNEDGKPLRDFAGMLREVDEGGLRPSGDVLVVDEYHDMTPIMASICEGWFDGFDTVIVGGDPLQAIYSYKGADPSFFTDLDLPEVLLDRTYRVPSNVWEYARGVIRHDPPEIEPDAAGGEVQAVKGDPYGVIDSYGEESTMYLARTQSQLYEIADDLKQRGVIFRSQEGIGGWNTSQTLLDLFNALQKVRDARPAENVNPDTGQTGMARYDDNDVAEGVRLPSNVTLESGEAKRLVRYTPAGYFADTKKSVRSYAEGASEVKGSDLLSRVEPSFWDDLTQGADSVAHLLTYDAKDTLRKALERYDRPFPVLQSAPVPDVLTIHASKGKEADTVALYDGIPGAVQRNIRNDPREQRAESRVWYVGCTRAAENLLVFRDQFDYTDSYLPSTA